MKKIIMGAFIALFCYPAMANVPGNFLDSVLAQFQAQTKPWEAIFISVTQYLFFALCSISLVIEFGEAALRKLDIDDVIALLARKVMWIGFSIWLLYNSADLARTLIDSFSVAASKVSPDVKFSPSNVVNLGMKVFNLIWQKTSYFDVGDSIFLALIGIIILLSFAWLAFKMSMLIVSAYVIVSAGVISMGFLGSSWTKEHALNYFTAVLGLAFHIFVMQLIYAIGYGMIEGWTTQLLGQNTTTDQYALVVCATLVFIGLMSEIPQMAASLASGRFNFNGNGLASASIAAAAVAAGGALLAAGATGAGYAAMKSAFGGGGDSDSGSGNNGDSSSGINTGDGDSGQGFSSSFSASENPSATQNNSSTMESDTGSQTSTSIDTDPSSTQSNAMNTAKKMAGMGANGLKTGVQKTGSLAGMGARMIANQSPIGRALADAGDKLNPNSNNEDMSQEIARIHTLLSDSASPQNTNSGNEFANNLSPSNNNE